MLKGIEIGTVATRDNIISNAVRYGYITEKKTVLDITEKGIYLVQALEQLSIDMSKEKTVETSIILKDIYRKDMTVNEAVKRTSDYFSEIIGRRASITKIKKPHEGRKKTDKDTREVIGTCPRCGRNIFENSKSYYCEGYREDPPCRFSLWKEDRFFTSKGITVTKPMAKCLIEGKVIALRGLAGSDGKSYGILVRIRNLQDERITFEMQREEIES